MSENVHIDAEGRVNVSAGALTKLAVEFSKEYSGKGYSAHEILVLALMHGIEIGYRSAKEAGL